MYLVTTTHPERGASILTTKPYILESPVSHRWTDG